MLLAGIQGFSDWTPRLKRSGVTTLRYVLINGSQYPVSLLRGDSIKITSTLDDRSLADRRFAVAESGKLPGAGPAGVRISLDVCVDDAGFVRLDCRLQRFAQI